MRPSKQEFIMDFFSSLDEQQIEYCVLRNYEDLPHQVSHDIDILLRGKDEHAGMKRRVLQIVQELEWDSICIHDADAFLSIVCYRMSNDSVDILKLDIWTDLRWRGVSWIDSKVIFDRRREVNGICVPERACEAVLTALKELMGGGGVPEKYYEKISTFANEDRDLFIETLSAPLKKHGDVIHRECVSGEFDTLNGMRGLLKRCLLVSDVWTYVRATSQRLSDKIHSFCKASGKLVAFVGPDGSGKTTIIDLQDKYFELIYPRRKKYHIRPGIFPELKTGHGFSSMNGAISGKKKSGTKSFRRSRLSRLAAWFVVLYYTMEYSLSRVRLKVERARKVLVLYDRYYYDFFAQPTTRDIIMPYRRMLMFFVEKPDIIIHLKADPEVVYTRKQELTINEIQEQNLHLEKALAGLETAHVVNTSTKSAKEIGVEVFRILIDQVRATR